MKTIIYRDVLHEERIPFPGFILLVMLFAGLSLMFLGFMVHSIINPDNLIDGASAWFWFFMFALFAPLTWLINNFRALLVTVTGEGLEVRYGRLSQAQHWENITGVRVIENPGLRYGGWGIRLAWSGSSGKKIVYNVWGTPVVEVDIAQGKFAKLVFSSNKADEVATIIQRHIQR